MNYDYIERNCPVCGKYFIASKEWAYKIGNKTFCRWNCLCAYKSKKAIIKNNPDKLKELRESKGLSLDKLSKLININRTSIVAHETLSMQIQPKTINKYCEFYGVSKDEITVRY